MLDVVEPANGPPGPNLGNTSSQLRRGRLELQCRYLDNCFYIFPCALLGVKSTSDSPSSIAFPGGIRCSRILRNPSPCRWFLRATSGRASRLDAWRRWRFAAVQHTRSGTRRAAFVGFFAPLNAALRSGIENWCTVQKMLTCLVELKPASTQLNEESIFF